MQDCTCIAKVLSCLLMIALNFQFCHITLTYTLTEALTQDIQVAGEKGVKSDHCHSPVQYLTGHFLFQVPKSGGTLKFLFTQQHRRTSSVRSSIQGSQMLMVPTSPGLPSPGPFDSNALVDGVQQRIPLTPGLASRPPRPPVHR